MDQLSGFDFIALGYDGDGQPTSAAIDQLQQHIG